jgi:hypothetical protein
MTSDALVHRVRASVFAREAEWRLEGDRLLWRESDSGAEAGAIDLAQVASVRLTQEPVRGRARMFCKVTTRSGAQALIASAHYLGALSGEDRRPTYAALVRALVAGVAARNPSARFVTGAAPVVWWTIVIGLALLFGALGALAVLFGRELFSTQLLLGVALVALGAPNLVRWLMSNRPGVFDPAQPPV